MTSSPKSAGSSGERFYRMKQWKLAQERGSSYLEISVREGRSSREMLQCLALLLLQRQQNAETWKSFLKRHFRVLFLYGKSLSEGGPSLAWRSLFWTF